MMLLLFISWLVLAEVSIFEEVSEIKEVKNNFASALETFVNDPSHTPIAFSAVADEFHALDLDNNHILDDSEVLLYLTGEARYALETAFPTSEDQNEGLLTFESFKAHAMFDEPKTCEEYIGQTDFSSEDLWKELTGRNIDQPMERDQLVMELAMATKQGVAPGVENNCNDIVFPTEIDFNYANCAEAKADGACEQSSDLYKFSTIACPKACGFCTEESNVQPTQWTIEDFFEFHTSEKLLDSFSGLSRDREMVLVDDMTHETKPEWEEKCQSVRRRLMHPCVATAAVGAVAGAIAGGVIQCKNPQYDNTGTATYQWQMRCAVRGVLGGAVSGAVIGGWTCLSISSLGRLWMRPFITNIWDQSFTVGSNAGVIYAANSNGWANNAHTTFSNVVTWSFQETSSNQQWYEFGSWTNWLGRRALKH